MVLIAVATLVGGGMTTWHYWNVELRAAQAERDTLSQRHLAWWKAELQRSEATRQPTAGRAKATVDAFLTSLSNDATADVANPAPPGR